MHQQAAGAAGFPVEDVALLIGGDVHPMDEQLPILYRTVGVLQIQRSGPDGLDSVPASSMPASYRSSTK